MRYLSPVIAVGLTLVCGIVLSALIGLDPLKAFHAFFIAPIDDLYGLGELGVKAAPLMLIATGLAIGYRSNIWAPKDSSPSAPSAAAVWRSISTNPKAPGCCPR